MDIAIGKKSPSHPKAFKIIGGKLFLNADKRKELPRSCHTSAVDLSKYHSTSSDEVDTELWFSPNHKFEYPDTLIEETYVQEDGWAATLLWIDDIEEL